eukprot:NODE_176_length_14102_cov_0.889595.p15 type:complete len:103 gc:universal NODE_176_length_14102_cov_0.889595:6440-6132(-)
MYCITSSNHPTSLSTISGWNSAILITVSIVQNVVIKKAPSSPRRPSLVMLVSYLKINLLRIKPPFSTGWRIFETVLITLGSVAGQKNTSDMIIVEASNASLE